MKNWFAANDKEGLQDFWRVYDAHYDRLNDMITEVAIADPQFGPLIASMSAEQRATEAAASRERMARAFTGDWIDYEQNLRQQGAIYARLGVTYASWYRLTRAVLRDLVPLMVSTYASEPPRLAAALLGMHTFFDWAMAILAEAYLDAKEADLRASEENLATTLDSIGDGVIATDLRGCVARMNPVAEQLTGWKAADAHGRPLHEVFHIINEHTRAVVESPADRVLCEGVVVGLANHTILVGKDGVERPIADSGAPIRDAGGEIRGVVLVFRDQSEQRAAEAALYQSQKRLGGTLASLSEGVIITNADGAVVYRNPAAEQITRSTADWTREIFWADGMLAVPVEQNPLARALRGELVRDCELWYRSERLPDGVLISTSAAPIRDESGALLGAVASLRDISYRRTLEEQRTRAAELELRNRQIQEASRLKSEFLANMSHELRTPLNAILGFTELLYDGEVQPSMPQYKEFLGDIMTSGQHLLQLINDVLDLSKVEAGKLEFHPEPVALAKIIGEVVSILRTTAADKRIRVETTIDDDIGEVVIDPSRLKQILYNYVSNALKFTGEGGRVTVRARHDQAGVLLEVEDTGIGIASPDLGLLFVEFQQLDGGPTKRHAGTGLGLALTKRLVEAQGGTVGVRSVVGAGSTFFAMLPRVAVGGKPVPAPRSIAGPAGAPTVLVIDDNERDQALIVRTLSEAGYAVETAATGAQALVKARERVFDAVTLDLLLPDMSGLDVLRALRGGELNQDVPVIVVTVVAERGAVAGYAVHDVLSKPLENATLLATLERCVVAPPENSGAVLVVDDDAGSLRLMAATLQQLGYRAVCVQRGEDGLAAARDLPPLAVVLDLMMPEMNGFEFLDRFRQLPQCRRTPVLVWTMKDLSSDEFSRLRDNARGVVPKGRVTGSPIVEELRAFLPPRADAPAPAEVDRGA